MPMGTRTRSVWVCEACGHEWLAKEKPQRCARCKSRKWDSGSVEIVEERRERPALRQREKSLKSVSTVSSTTVGGGSVLASRFFAKDHDHCMRCRAEMVERNGRSVCSAGCVGDYPLLSQYEYDKDG